MDNLQNLGGWSIDRSCYDFILSILPKGSTILEFGSGFGTGYLSQDYNMISVENNIDWINRFTSNYIYAPIINYNSRNPAPEGFEDQTAWYHRQPLEFISNIKYDLILIDGPEGKYGRAGILQHLDLLNTNVPIIIDDISRKAEFDLMTRLSEILNRPFTKLDWNTGYIL
jgi:hypothetical protein